MSTAQKQLCHPHLDIPISRSVSIPVAPTTPEPNESVRYLMKLLGLVVGVVCLEEGVSVPSSCSLRVSILEWLSGVVAPLPWGVDWPLTGSRRELGGQGGGRGRANDGVSDKEMEEKKKVEDDGTGADLGWCVGGSLCPTWSVSGSPAGTCGGCTGP